MRTKLRELVLNLMQKEKDCWFTVTDIVVSLGNEKCGKNPYSNVKSNISALFFNGQVTRKQLETNLGASTPKNAYRYCDVLVVHSETAVDSAAAPVSKLTTDYDIPLIAPPPYRPHPSERYRANWVVARGGAMDFAQCQSVGTR